jgi:molybdopterin converting factor small subunit
MITVRVLFFSTIRARVGEKHIQVELPAGARVEDLKKEIARLYPQAAATIVSMLASVNQVFSEDSTEIPDRAEVAFFPYVTGG